MDRRPGIEALGLIRAVFAPQVCLAVLAMIAFWCTIVEPDKLMLSEEPGKAGGKNDLLANSPALLDLVESQVPMKLLLEHKADLAVESAHALAELKPHDLVATMSAGNVLFKTGDKDGGYQLLLRSVSLAPRGRYVRLNLAQMLTESKQYDKAIAQYALISQKYPHWSEPHKAMAMIYRATDNYQAEADELGKALDTDNDGELHKMHGLALGMLGHAREGLDEYVQGDNLETNSYGLPEDLKKLLGYWHTPDRALYELQRQMNEHPDDPNIKLTMGRLYLYCGRIPEAKAILMDARKKADKNIDVHRNLALVYQKLGDPTQAVSEFMLSVNLEKNAKQLN